jgi:hypothetical protein
MNEMHTSVFSLFLASKLGMFFPLGWRRWKLGEEDGLVEDVTFPLIDELQTVRIGISFWASEGCRRWLNSAIASLC